MDVAMVKAAAVIMVVFMTLKQIARLRFFILYFLLFTIKMVFLFLSILLFFALKLFPPTLNCSLFLGLCSINFILHFPGGGGGVGKSEGCHYV